jgi:hypothetical protein
MFIRTIGETKRLFGLIFILSLLLLTTSCAFKQVPLQILQTYNDAFSRAREAGTEIYEQAEPAIVFSHKKTQQAKAQASDGNPSNEEDERFPTVFDRPVSAQGRPASVEARIQAMNVVAIYNETILKLASGSTADSVRSDVGQLAQSVSSLAKMAGVGLPFVGAVVEPLSGLIAIAEKARSANEARNALLKGEDTIAKILNFLDKDIDRIYQIQLSWYQLLINTNAFTDVSDVRKAFFQFISKQQKPTGDAEIQSWTKITEEYHRLVSGVYGLKPEKPDDIIGTNGSNPYDQSTTNIMVTALRSASQNYQDKVNEWNTFQAALGRYATLLSATKRCLAEAVTAAGNPTSDAEQLAELFATASEVRTYALQVIDILRG